MPKPSNSLPTSFFSQFGKLNRTRAVDSSQAAVLHDLYLFLFSQDSLALRNKQMALESAADSKDSWLVVAISMAALKHIFITRSAKGLHRAHPLQRIERAKTLFERQSPMKKDEFLNYFLQNDTVALVPMDDNKSHGVKQWGRLIAVPPGRLMGGSFSKYATKADLSWVDDEAKRLRITT